MNSLKIKKRVLIFIGSLRSGGKERRLVELLTFFKSRKDYEFLVVLTKNEIHYKKFYELSIPYIVINKMPQKTDWKIFYHIYKICKEFRPHIIHSWGRMQTFYSLPSVLFQQVELINSQITAAPPKISKWSLNNMIDRLNFRFSKIILSNSRAGIVSYNPPKNKNRVIYNGLNLNRFENLITSYVMKQKYKIQTPYVILMAASFTDNKDYYKFYRVAQLITKQRNDVTFIGVGGYDKDDSIFKEMVGYSTGNPQILFPGRISDVESLINACDVGVLFSNTKVHGEGISNSLMEFMALSKPVIANDAGGTKEILKHNENGFLITDQTDEEIASLIEYLIDSPEKRLRFGEAGKRIIDKHFSLETMGNEFDKVYKEVAAVL